MYVEPLNEARTKPGTDFNILESWWMVQTRLDVAELASEPNLRTWSRRFRLACVRGRMKGLLTESVTG
jgi:hypothetical protein